VCTGFGVCEACVRSFTNQLVKNSGFRVVGSGARRRSFSLGSVSLGKTRCEHVRVRSAAASMRPKVLPSDTDPRLTSSHCAKVWIVDSWIRGFVDSWIRGFVDSWIRGFVDSPNGDSKNLF